MKLNLTDINYFFLTCNNEIRKTHMISEFKNLNLIEVNPVMNIGKKRSGATGFMRIFDLACVYQDKTKPFQPFGIFEDDAIKNREFPTQIEIPDNADILYTGLSCCGINKTRYCFTVAFDNIDENIIKIYNMLSLHGLIVCSMRGLLSLQKCILEDYFNNRDWDICVAQIQPYLNVYAFKNPLVYQYGKIGGQEPETNINYIDKANISLPDEWINTQNVSIITTYKKQDKALMIYNNSK